MRYTLTLVLWLAPLSISLSAGQGASYLFGTPAQEIVGFGIGLYIWGVYAKLVDGNIRGLFAAAIPIYNLFWSWQLSLSIASCVVARNVESELGAR